MKEEAPDLVVLGDVNEDLYAQVATLPQKGCCTFGTQIGRMVGGTGTNVAVAAARLGLKTVFVSAVGNDGAGEGLVQLLVKEGIDERYIKRVSQPTGSALALIGADGERTFIALRTGCADWQLRADDTPRDLISRARAVFVSGVLVTEEKKVKESAAFAWEGLVQAERAGTLTFFDPNLRAEDWQIPPGVTDKVAEFARQSHFYLPGESEQRAISRYNTTQPTGRNATIIKMGERGCVVHTGGQQFQVPARPTEARDTTGAGDSFDAGFIAGIMRGLSVLQAAEYATAVASMTVSRVGTISAFPREQEISSSETRGCRL